MDSVIGAKINCILLLLYVHICDASEHGLGGFASHGRAWRFELPTELSGRVHINLLEFLA